MKRKLTAILIILTVVFTTVACQSSSSEKTTSKQRVAKSIPEGFENYGETRPADYYIKATNYDYDYEELDYKLVWSDEFDYEGLPDETKWTYDVGTGSYGWGNNELQRYTDDSNAWVKEGVLTIELRKEKDEFDKDIYTSARLKTKTLGDWLYGKFEIKAKLPTGKGTWPAIWMLPTKTTEYGGWPGSGEIDIMEHVGYLQNVIFSNVHCRAFNGAEGTQKGSGKTVKTASDKFHVYGLEWLPDKMIFTVDGETLFTYDPHEFLEFSENTEVTKDEWPFDKEFHLIMNIAYGGNWGGRLGVDDSCLPQQMQVDYVRVYQSETITALAGERE